MSSWVCLLANPFSINIAVVTQHRWGSVGLHRACQSLLIHLLLGNIYMMKATSALKSRKLLGIPGFFSRLKEKGAAVKEAWGLITSA